MGSFSAHAIIPVPITITTDLSPGTAISIPFTLNWTGGGSDSVITVQLATHDPAQPEVPTLFASARASDGSVTVVNPPTFGLLTHAASHRATTLSGSPTQGMELIVTQTPALGPSQIFTAPGLTLGGEQTWKYVFDFTGLKQQ